MKKDNKKFDCVLLMRKIREELNEKYLKNPEFRKAQLSRIRKKYNFTKEDV